MPVEKELPLPEFIVREIEKHYSGDDVKKIFGIVDNCIYESNLRRWGAELQAPEKNDSS